MNGALRMLRVYFTPLRHSLLFPIAFVMFCVVPMLPTAFRAAGSPEILRGEQIDGTMVFFSLLPIGMFATGRDLMGRVHLALGMGVTRRDFWIGTTLGFVITSAVMTVTGLVMWALEVATNGWFLQLSVFNWEGMLGQGFLMPVALFALCFAMLNVGGLPRLKTSERAIGLQMGVWFAAYAGISAVLIALGAGGPALGLWTNAQNPVVLVGVGLVMALLSPLVTWRFSKQVAA